MNADGSRQANSFFGPGNGVLALHVNRLGASDACLWESELGDDRASLIEIAFRLRA
jgi:hypothetical protein